MIRSSICESSVDDNRLREVFAEWPEGFDNFIYFLRHMKTIVSYPLRASSRK